MNKEEVLIYLNKIPDRPPLGKIEVDLGIPKGTLNQILKKESKRGMPFNYRERFKAYCERPCQIITLPNGRATRTNDPIILEYFEQLKSKKPEPVFQKNESDSEDIPFPIHHKIEIMIPPKMDEKRKRHHREYLENYYRENKRLPEKYEI